YAAELVALAPDVILATGQEATGALQQVTRTVPIVFVLVPDPVGAGFVDSLARPGGNVTGFTPWEYGFSAKWLELLKEIAPGVKRVAVLRDAAVPEVGQFAIIQAAAPSLGVDVSPISARDAGEIERAITTFARSTNGGLMGALEQLADQTKRGGARRQRQSAVMRQMRRAIVALLLPMRERSSPGLPASATRRCCEKLRTPRYYALFQGRPAIWN